MVVEEAVKTVSQGNSLAWQGMAWLLVPCQLLQLFLMQSNRDHLPSLLMMQLA